MTVLTDLEEFVTAHRSHGELTWWTTEPTATGYSVQVACPCGVTFERWVLPYDAAEDLLTEALQRVGGPVLAPASRDDTDSSPTV